MLLIRGVTAMKRDKTLTKKITLCGIMAALSITFLYIGGITVLDLSVILLCSLVTMFVMTETGERMTWVYFAVTATLALMLLPSKLYAIEYTLFGALYPILKMHLERLKPMLAWVLKILTLDLMLLGCVLLGQLVFSLGDEYFSLGALTFILGSLFFILFDRALTVCISFYIVKLRDKLKLK